MRTVRVVIVAVVLDAAQTETVIEWGELVEVVLISATAAVTAFLGAMRGKRD